MVGVVTFIGITINTDTVFLSGGVVVVCRGGTGSHPIAGSHRPAGERGGGGGGIL